MFFLFLFLNIIIEAFKSRTNFVNDFIGKFKDVFSDNFHIFVFRFWILKRIFDINNLLPRITIIFWENKLFSVKIVFIKFIYICRGIATAVVWLMSCSGFCQCWFTLNSEGGAFNLNFSKIAFNIFFLLLLITRERILKNSNIWLVYIRISVTNRQSLILMIVLLLFSCIYWTRALLLLWTHIITYLLVRNTVILFGLPFCLNLYLTCCIFLIIDGVIVTFWGRWLSEFLLLHWWSVLLIIILLLFLLVLPWSIPIF